MKESNDNTVSIEDYIQTIETISNQLKEKGEITLNEYNSYNIIKRKEIELKEDSQKLNGNNNQGGFNYHLQLNKLNLLLEKIQSDIQDKKEYEFISNYFISENSPFSCLDLSISTKDNSNTDALANDTLHPQITEQSLSILNSIDSDSFNSLGDALKLTSHSFLLEKAKFSDEIISKIKSNSVDITQSRGVTEESGATILKRKSEKKTLPELNKSKKSNSINQKNNATTTSSSSTQNPNDKIDKEIEEEINNQIFKYTKSMKENARSFNSKLKQDNKTLTSIEEIQIRDKDKTDTEQKRLKEFNYTLSIGFFRLLMMFISVIVAFAFTLLIMRIFPKFA